MAYTSVLVFFWFSVFVCVFQSTRWWFRVLLVI